LNNLKQQLASVAKFEVAIVNMWECEIVYVVKITNIYTILNEQFLCVKNCNMAKI